MTPNVQPFRRARGRWLVFLMNTALWGLAVLSALEPEPAFARNGATRTMNCPNCYSSNDFIAAGLAQANSLGVPGLYVVVSQTYARTGLIQVTGEVPACGLSCDEGLLNESAAALGQDGSPLGSDSELNNIDVGLFGVDRSLPLEVPIVPGCGAQQSACGDSLASSTDAGVGVVVGEALEAAGYTSASIPPVLSIAVTFQNGDVAVYQHISGGDITAWKWFAAWNSNHAPIDRNGNVINNNNTAGSGGGIASGITNGMVYGVADYTACFITTTSSQVPLLEISGDFDGDVVLITSTYPPC